MSCDANTLKEGSLMKNLKKPVEEWVMDSARMGADRYESVSPELMDVCGDCKVEGGCHRRKSCPAGMCSLRLLVVLQ